MKKTSSYQWQGESVEVEFGFSMVQENKEKPMYWYNYLVAISPEGSGENKFATIPAIRITAKSGYQFVIANHHAYGIHKLEQGGWPNHGHASLPLESFHADNGFTFTEFDSKGLHKLQASQDEWMKKTHPEEYKKMEGLKKLISKR